LAALILPVLPPHLIVEVFKVLDVAAEPEEPIKLPSPEFKWKSQEDHSLSEHGSSSHVALGRSAQSHRVFASLDLLLTSFGR
jgi:hypothetical protein